MYHWYLLAQDAIAASKRSAAGFARFSAGHGPNPIDSAPEEMRWKFFWLGAVEFFPIGLALGLGPFLETQVQYGRTLSAGGILSLTVCWILRRKVPATVIHIVTKTEPKVAKL
jgi:hypothetical protein